MFSISNFWVPFHVMKLHCHLLEVKEKQIDEKKVDYRSFELHV